MQCMTHHCVKHTCGLVFILNTLETQKKKKKQHNSEPPNLRSVEPNRENYHQANHIYSKNNSTGDKSRAQASKQISN